MRGEPGADIQGDLMSAALHRVGARLQIGEGLSDIVIGDIGECPALIDGLAARHVPEFETRHHAHRQTAG